MAQTGELRGGQCGWGLGDTEDAEGGRGGWATECDSPGSKPGPTSAELGNVEQVTYLLGAFDFGPVKRRHLPNTV